MRKRTCAKLSSCALMNRFCISLWQAFSWPRQNATRHAWSFARVSTWTPICLTFRISSTTAVNLERTERCAAKMRPRRPQSSNRPVPPPYPALHNQAAERCGHADQLILSRESGGRAPRCSFLYNDPLASPQIYPREPLCRRASSTATPSSIKSMQNCTRKLRNWLLPESVRDSPAISLALIPSRQTRHRGETIRGTADTRKGDGHNLSFHDSQFIASRWTRERQHCGHGPRGDGYAGLDSHWRNRD